jgi:hypothetical protein
MRTFSLSDDDDDDDDDDDERDRFFELRFFRDDDDLFFPFLSFFRLLLDRVEGFLSFFFFPFRSPSASLLFSVFSSPSTPLCVASTAFFPASSVAPISGAATVYFISQHARNSHITMYYRIRTKKHQQTQQQQIHVPTYAYVNNDSKHMCPPFHSIPGDGDGDREGDFFATGDAAFTFFFFSRGGEGLLAHTFLTGTVILCLKRWMRYASSAVTSPHMAFMDSGNSRSPSKPRGGLYI